MSDDVKVRIYRDPRNDELSIHVRMRDGIQNLALRSDGTWDPVDPSAEYPLAFARMPGDFEILQKLADALYEFGITPHGYIPQRGEIEATERHLADMRSLVSTLMKVSLDTKIVEVKR